MSYLAPHFNTSGSATRSSPSSVLGSADSILKKRPKYTRSKTGCLTCRQKKVKCDEQKPGCARCAHSKRDCEWPTEAPSSTTPARRRRVSGSLPTPSASSPSTSSETREQSPESPTSVNKISLVQPHRIHIPTDAAYYPPSPLSSASPCSTTSYPSHGASVSYVSTLEAAYIPAVVESAYLPPTVTPARPVADNARYYSRLNQYEIPPPPPPQYGQPQMIASSPWPPAGPAEPAASPRPMVPYAIHHYGGPREEVLMDHFLKISGSHLVSHAPAEGMNPIAALIEDCSPNRDALQAHRFAMSALAAVHNTHMHLCIGNDITKERLEILQLRQAADQHLNQATLSRSQLSDDASLAAATMLVLSDVMLGQSDWVEHLKMCRDIVNGRGGVDKLLSAAPSSLSSPWTATIVLSRARLCVEMLTVLETFGCLTTGDEPSLLTEGSMVWYYMLGQRPTDESFHLVSLEHIFGFSRSLLPFVARVSSLLSQVTFSPEPIVEGRSPSASAPDFVHKLAANVSSLMYELDSWNPTLYPGQERVRLGNLAFRYALQIMLLRDVYSVSHLDARVQKLSIGIFDIVREMANSEHMQIKHLLFPLTVACCQADPSMRSDAVWLVSNFRGQYCFQYECVNTVIQEVWARLDVGHSRPLLRQVLHELDYSLLLI
ncbi:fungal-specific transcription factor domain-containing protein [Auriculariales sp. MPI-PUGE-AT-0066]|nr:fungal-specific transcription factor domain-containing protein [Auriculariales sp. MPI-PUGE-AT-0066]